MYYAVASEGGGRGGGEPTMAKKSPARIHTPQPLVDYFGVSNVM